MRIYPTIIVLLFFVCGVVHGGKHEHVAVVERTRRLVNFWNILFLVKGPHGHGGGGGGSSSGSGGGGSSGSGGSSSGSGGGSGGGGGGGSGGGGGGGSGSGGDGSHSSKSSTPRMSQTLNIAMMVAAAAAVGLAVAAVATGQRRTTEKSHNLRGILAKRMALFGGHASPDSHIIDRPRRRGAEQKGDPYAYQAHGPQSAMV